MEGFKASLVGADPIPVEHLWPSMPHHDQPLRSHHGAVEDRGALRCLGGKVAPQGKYPLPARPGLGFDLDEKQVARYRFEGTRPMARVFHPDGAVAAW